MSTITVEQYTEKSIVVRGNTIPYKEKLLSIGGKWNKMLKGGEGWIFPLTKKPIVEKALSEPPSVHTDDIPVNNDNNITEKKQYKSSTRTKSSIDVSSEVILSKKEYLQLISRIERLEQIVSKYNNDCSSSSSSSASSVSFVNPVKTKTVKSIPPPLSSIDDEDICNPECSDEEEKESYVPLMRRKKN